MKKEVRHVKVEIDGGTIKEAHCTCAIGLGGRCRHIAIVLMHISKTTSSTDLPCAWLKKTPPTGEITTVSDAFQKKSRTIIVKQPAADDIKKKCLALLNTKQLSVPAGWLLQAEPSASPQGFSELFLEEIFNKIEFKNSSSHESFLRRYFAKQLTDEKIIDISNNTIGQWENNLYCLLHKHRITGSNFGYVLKAIGRNRYPATFFQRLTNVYNLDKVKSVSHGKNNEHTAFMLCEKYHFPGKLRSAGFYLHPNGVLGCSPDGVGDDFILEIKCPFKWMDKKLDRSVLTEKAKYIVYYPDCVPKGEELKLKVNENHEYYDQIQGEIHLCQKDYGMLCIWTKVDYLVHRIDKSPTWAANFKKLENAFYRVYLPHILK